MFLLLTLACAALGCRHTDYRTERADTRHVVRRAQHAVTVAQRRDTTGLGPVIHQLGGTIDTVLAASGPYTVLIYRHDDGATLATFRGNQSGMSQVGTGVEVAGLPYPQVQLLPASPAVYLRITTFDDAAENIIGTAVDRLDASGVHREYADSRSVCKAADWRRSTAPYSLRTYVNSPFVNHCADRCPEVLRQTMGFEPARIVDLTRIDNTWMIEPLGADSTTVRQGYTRALDLLRRKQLPECSAESARLVKAFTAWRARL